MKGFLGKRRKRMAKEKVENKNFAKSYKDTLLEEYKEHRLYSDFNEEEIEIIKKVKDYTMTSPERMVSLYRGIEYIVNSNIKGDIVECGVWKGGSMMIVIQALLKHCISDRKLFLYDTYTGMPKPSDNDIDFKGISAKKIYEENLNTSEGESNWCLSTLEEVQNNIQSTGYPIDNCRFIKGKVENTLNEIVPERISLLRLDTDWYESTKIELEILFPRLNKGGIIIIDDYGHWNGVKKAVDEFFIKNNIRILLCRVDYTCRIGIKQ